MLLKQKLRDCEDSASLIDGLLEGTAQFYGADRAYIIEADWDIGIGLNTYEWCQPGVEHQKDMLQFLTMEVFPRRKRFLIENLPVIIPDTSSLKEEYPDEYAFFTKYGVSSLLCAPFSKRINQGFVGVDNPTRFQDDPTFLFIICYAIVLELNEIKMQQTDSFDKYFKLGRCLNQRDTIAVRKIVSGLTKLLYPDGKYTEGEIEEILKYAIEGRRRVKEQLKKIGGMEFYDVQFSYIRLSNMEEVFVPVLEQGGGKLIPEGVGKPGHIYTVANGTNGMMGLFFPFF